MYGQNRAIYYQAYIFVSLEDFKHVYNAKNVKLFLHSIKMSSPKEVKSLKVIKSIKELKNLEDAIEEMNKKEEKKQKLSAIEREK